MTTDDIARPDLGELYHIAMVVHDIEEAAERLSALGIAGWGTPFSLEIPSLYRGRDTRASVRARFAPAGPIAFELVQPTGGDSPMAAFLRDRGEGIEHLGYRTDDLPATVERAVAQGMIVEFEVRDEHGLAIVFLSAESLFGVHVELIRREPGPSIGPWLKP